MGFRAPTNAQAIEVIVRHQPGLTQSQIAQTLFGTRGYQQRVNGDVRWLEQAGYIKSDGGRPARYSAGRPGPSGP